MHTKLTKSRQLSDNGHTSENVIATKPKHI
jgi:hypothetical protein